MQPLIIVEGPDGTGKSSLAKFAARRLKAAFFHASGKKSLHLGMMDYHTNLLESAKTCLEVSDVPVVFDRHWPSEWVYGQILRPHVSDQVYNFRLMEKLLQPLNPIYIFCESDKSYERMHDVHNNEQQDHWYDRSVYAALCGEYILLKEDMVKYPHNRVHTYVIEQHGTDMQSFLDKVINEQHKPSVS